MISSILHPSLASHSHTPTLFLPLSRMLSMLFTFLSVLIATAVADTDQIPSELKVDVYEGPTECEDEHKVMNGQSVSMHYTGTIDQSSVTGEKGKQFYSSRDRGQTFDFVIGQGQVIKGWDEGILGLCVGAKANLVIPPEMAYAPTQSPRIPSSHPLMTWPWPMTKSNVCPRSRDESNCLPFSPVTEDWSIVPV